MKLSCKLMPRTATGPNQTPQLIRVGCLDVLWFLPLCMLTLFSKNRLSAALYTSVWLNQNVLCSQDPEPAPRLLAPAVNSRQNKA